MGFTLYLLLLSCLKMKGVAYIVLLGSLCDAKVILYSVVMLLVVLRRGSTEYSVKLAVEIRLLARLLELKEA